jgi:LysM repeat protein
MIIAIPRFTGPAKTVVAKNLNKESEPVTKGRVTKDRKNALAKSEEAKTHHIVKKGETLASISDKYGVDVADLKSINRLKSGKVYPNMKLALASHVEKKSAVKIKYHIVKKGETLNSISDKYGVGIDAIKSINRLKTNKIQAKMKLKIVVSEG